MHLLDKLLEMVKNYNPDEVEKLIKAYNIAESAHNGQLRESGEPYIIHPINVCINFELYNPFTQWKPTESTYKLTELIREFSKSKHQ